MNKIYAFIIIIPVIALIFLKSMAFYEYDTKQKYIKNAIDAVAHKVMITGVMTAGDRKELVDELKRFGDFEDTDVIMEYGTLQSDGSISGLGAYTPGNVMDRGEIFSIYVQSENESTLSRMEGAHGNGTDKLYYKAKATCRIEKNRNAGQR